MPHCSKQLTNNLLEENWDSNKLQNLVLFCNSFDKLCLSQPGLATKLFFLLTFHGTKSLICLKSRLASKWVLASTLLNWPRPLLISLFRNFRKNRLNLVCRLCETDRRKLVSDQAWSLLERILKQQRAGLVIKAASVCTETPVENCFRLSDVFNDLNLHSFRSDQFADQNENFWTVDPALAIQEDDLEFVPRTTVETY